MSNKSENQGREHDEGQLENPGRRSALTKIGLLLAGAITLGAGSADARKKKEPIKPYQNYNETGFVDYTSRSRVAQQLERGHEVIGQEELNRLVMCNDLISATYINPLFLNHIYKEKWRGEVLQSMLLIIQHPYDFSYEIDRDDNSERDIIITKRCSSENNEISGDFKMKIDMYPDSRLGCITQVVDTMTDSSSDGDKLRKVGINPYEVNEGKIARTVSRQKDIISNSLGDQTTEDKRDLANPLKIMFMLLNKTVPKHIARVMKARGFDEETEFNSFPDDFKRFQNLTADQNNNLETYNDYIEDDFKWLLTVGAIDEKPGFYRIIMMPPDITDSKKYPFIDISLDGYLMAAINGDVAKNTRGDGRTLQIDDMYYETDPNGNPEHLLKNRYYEMRSDARGKR